MSSLARVERTVTAVVIPLTLAEIRQKAKDSGTAMTCCNVVGAYREIQSMATDAGDIASITAIVQGALDDDECNELKIIAIVVSLLGEIARATRVPSLTLLATCKLELLCSAWAAIPDQHLCFFTEIDETGMEPSLQLLRLKERRLDELLRWKGELALSTETLDKLQRMVALRKNLESMSLPPFMWG